MCVCVAHKNANSLAIWQIDFATAIGQYSMSVHWGKDNKQRLAKRSVLCSLKSYLRMRVARSQCGTFNSVARAETLHPMGLALTLLRISLLKRKKIKVKTKFSI